MGSNIDGRRPRVVKDIFRSELGFVVLSAIGNVSLITLLCDGELLD